MVVVGEGEGVALLMTAENYDQRTFARSSGSHQQRGGGRIIFFLQNKDITGLVHVIKLVKLFIPVD